MTSSPERPVARRRILWLSHFLPWPPKGGLMQRSYYLMREAARYHDVRLIAFRQRAHQRDEDELRAAVDALSKFVTLAHVLDLPEDRQPGGRKLLALRSLLPGPPYTIRWGTCGSYRDAVRAAVDDFKPDVVHFDTVSLAPYLECIGDTPAVLNHHNIESHMLVRRAEKEANPLKRFYFWQEGQRLAAYERMTAHRFSLHLVCADLDGQRFEANVGAVRIAVVPNGVDVNYFQPAPTSTPQRPDSLVFVGDLSWYPNIGAIRFFLNEVWPLIIRDRPSASLRVAGRNPPMDFLDHARKDSRIEILGFVDDIRPLVAESMVYVCPIFDGGGTKLKMVDAMAMGKPIVGHPVAAEGLGLTSGIDVLLTEDPHEMANLCVRLFDDSALRERLADAARSRAEQIFSFELIGRKLAALYSDELPATVSNG